LVIKINTNNFLELIFAFCYFNTIILNRHIVTKYHDIGEQCMKTKKKDVDNWLYYIEMLNNRNNKGKIKQNNH
jgi:hypothetical protein